MMPPNPVAAGSDARRIPFARTEISLEAREAALRVLESGWVTTGPLVAEFERAFADWIGVAHAVAVSSCTDAIELALRALNLPPRSRVLVSTMTFCGAVNAIVHAGLQPVLVDVNARTCMPDPATTAEAVRRAGGAEAMLVLHYAGFPAPVEDLAEAAGLPLHRVIEDAAHALGTWVGERQVGTISAATCFSFYATKNLPIGEGGMISTDDPRLADHVRRGRLHGMTRDAWKRYLPGNGWRYTVEEPGLKANMTDVQAAIGRAQLSHLPAWQSRREGLAARYDEKLADVEGIRPAARPARGRHAWHLYVCTVEDSFGIGRDELIDRLAERGIDCSVHFVPVHRMPYARRILGLQREEDFPFAEDAFRRIASLPLYPALSADDVDAICEEIRSLRGRGKGHAASAAVSGGASS
jgi:perosamine synthetase